MKGIIYNSRMIAQLERIIALPRQEARTQIKEYAESVIMKPTALIEGLQQLPVNRILDYAGKTVTIDADAFLDIIFFALSLEECIRYASSPIPPIDPIFKFLHFGLSQPIPDLYSALLRAQKRHTVPEKTLAICRLLAHFCHDWVTDASIAHLLPGFVRGCAQVVQQYLQLKNEPARGSDDRIQSDRVMIEGC